MSQAESPERNRRCLGRNSTRVPAPAYWMFNDEGVFSRGALVGLWIRRY
jgi:hypothetical protein